MPRLLLTITLLACLLPAAAQDHPRSELHGRVVDYGTNDPLPLVHVFLDGTSIGDVTGEDGSFGLTGIPVGTYELVVSYVGYDRYQRIFQFVKGRMPDLTVNLNEATTSTGEVVVVAERDREWERRLDRFIRMFVGTSRFADDCTLKNPEFLDFSVNPILGILNARASRALVIENRALGYIVTYWMDYFGGNDRTVEFSGKAYYESMVPRDDREARRWESNRRVAYLGSVRHFLASAASDRLLDEEFTVAGSREPGGREQGYLAGDYVTRDTLTGLFVIRFPRALRVDYARESEASEYTQSTVGWNNRPNGPLRKQTSWLTLRTPAAYFDEDGRLENPLNLVRYGYWGWEERMAYTLPWDYEFDRD